MATLKHPISRSPSIKVFPTILWMPPVKSNIGQLLLFCFNHTLHSGNYLILTNTKSYPFENIVQLIPVFKISCIAISKPVIRKGKIYCKCCSLRCPVFKIHTHCLSTNPTILKQLHLFTCVNNQLANVGYTNFSNSNYTVYHEKFSPILYRNTS